MKRLIPLFAALLSLSGPMAAQTSPDTVKHRNDCRLAEQVLSTGSPSPHRQWALGYIPSCGYDVWAGVAAVSVRRTKTSSDLAAVGAEWRRLNFLRDSVLFDAAVEIAADRSASPGVRVLAIRYLLSLADPNGVYGFGALTEGGDQPGAQPRCITGQISGEVVTYDGKPLPADYRQRIAQLTADLLAEDGVPPMVRSAALCAHASPVRRSVVR